ncbi:hypothetical protein ILUMI_26356 [Ignelater luminosus]|uniref:Uncharacterized protein n=1 Tax=Ignelater luminosus TaxID=2038154 RepID=A0A8K0C5X4_IGNLU|nr:hypothetical protein ILUMI_26356 [Ignelater luminosus]
MTLTVVEISPPLSYLTIRSKTSSDSAEKNCQVTNRKISYKGNCQQRDVNDFRACQPNPNSCPGASSRRIETCVGPNSKNQGSCGAPSSGKQIVTCVGLDTGMALEGRCLDILESLREPLAEYQEKHGLSKNEQFGFITLMTSLCHHAYNAVITILTMLYNLLPLLEGFLYLARFILDKLIEICRTRETGEKVLKSVIFFGEMAAIVLIVMIIFGFILLPVWCLFSTIFGKILGIILSNA